MQLTENFLEDEVREGFYVSGMMKKVWASELTTLDFLDRFCRKHHIKWFIAFGTLLGAVRHRGFIPWDDDADVIMLRGDFNRFLEAMSRDHSSGYIVGEQRMEETNSLLAFVSNSKVRINFDPEFLKRNYQNPYSASLDVFVYDYISDNEEDEEWRDTSVRAVINVRLTVEKLVKELNEEDRTDQQADEMAITADDIRKLADRFPTAGNAMDMLRDVDALTGHKIEGDKPLMHQLNVLYTGLIAYFQPSEGKDVRFYPSGLYSKRKPTPRNPKKWFENVIYMPFENLTLPAPAAYDSVLRYSYGDYQKKVIGDASHGYPFFAKLEQDIVRKGHLEQSPYTFAFSASDLPDLRERTANPKTEIRRMLDVLKEMETLIPVQEGCENLADFLYLLEILQNSYIKIGSAIENRAGKGHPVISVVEGACETLYNAYEEARRVGEVHPKTAERVRAACEDADHKIHRQYADKKEILFLLDRAKNWKAVESVCRTCMEDPNCSVSIMLVPWHPKRGDSSIQEDTFCDTLALPSGMTLVSPEEYDIGRVHPDVIFTTYGYDNFNYVRSTDLKYYTRFLWKETDRLIYIPWFTLTEFGKGDPQWATVPYFARIPGVLYSDQTIVQSDRIKHLYIDAMMETDGSVPESYWDKKILALGSPLWDWKEYTGVGPDDGQMEKKANQSYGEYIWRTLSKDWTAGKTD
ncbi:MAG: LicD family protein [Lachnospiraceae bacterium]|nr:LicD family protein [Lachnospiraceae bacterium]MCH4028449.1 LicD family protein [Lachnospiraceae bacterium]MCH4066298.1 LicD family protein [Lachnospiraceae bacterium]MCH4112329.1 LicD family protein [Lachnospiraceae bacterium]MCI1353308.1 LicD family protein [Lachnospiraceae bacterium]